MAYKIKWTSTALEDFNIIIDYLIKEWSSLIASDFEIMVNEKLIALSYNPFIGIQSAKKSSIRSILLTKHNRLFYRVTDNIVEVINIIDTRSNPKNNPF